MRQRTLVPFILAVIFAVAAVPGSSFAAVQLVMQPIGSSQGPIMGDSTLPGYENWVDLSSFQHGVSFGTDQNGVPVGNPNLSEITVSCQADRSTIPLFQAQAQLEGFSSLKFEWVDDNPAKMPMVRLRYELVGAYLTSTSESSGGSVPSLSYSFSFSSLIITDVVEGTTVTFGNKSLANAEPTTKANNILMAQGPHPTHGQTEFHFSLPSDSNARLRLYDQHGHLVKEVHDGWTSNEPSVAIWDGKDNSGVRVSQGVYLAKLTYPGYEVTQRIAVLR